MVSDKAIHSQSRYIFSEKTCVNSRTLGSKDRSHVRKQAGRSQTRICGGVVRSDVLCAQQVSFHTRCVRDSVAAFFYLYRSFRYGNRPKHAEIGKYNIIIVKSVEHHKAAREKCNLCSACRALDGCPLEVSIHETSWISDSPSHAVTTYGSWFPRYQKRWPNVCRCRLQAPCNEHVRRC